jgi:hypothetical protein
LPAFLPIAMVTIFAARHMSGETRYVGGVPRGAACQCFCLVCGSPMLARKGLINEWHFAHEHGQERPECRAGAANLLRRIAIEELRRLAWAVGALTVANPIAGRAALVWNDEPSGPIEEIGSPGSATDAAARVRLVHSGVAFIFVVIGDETGPPNQSNAALRLHVPVPETLRIRSEEEARDFVRHAMRLEWLNLPDTRGIVEAALREAEALQRAQMEAERRASAARSSDAGRRWATIRRGMVSLPNEPTQMTDVPATSPNPGASSAARAKVDWAPGLAGPGSLQYRYLEDGTQWVYYPAGTAWRLSPVPEPFDGWDEYFPPTLAVIADDKSLRVVDEMRLLMWFNKRTKESFIDSDPRLVERHFRASKDDDDSR